MSFNAFRENKIIAKITEYTVSETNQSVKVKFHIEHPSDETA